MCNLYPWVTRGQQRVLNPLELQLQVLVSSSLQAARPAFYVSAGVWAKLSSSGLYVRHFNAKTVFQGPEWRLNPSSPCSINTSSCLSFGFSLFSVAMFPGQVLAPTLFYIQFLFSWDGGVGGWSLGPCTCQAGVYYWVITLALCSVINSTKLTDLMTL